MTEAQLKALMTRRWKEACHRAGLRNKGLTGALGEHEHFRTPRGYAVTFVYNDGSCHLVLSRKMLRADQARVDAILRHEFGHVLDAYLGRELDRRLGPLPKPAELRADAIAEAVWQAPIFYDQDDVQTTKSGTRPRPRRLGWDG